MQPTKNQTPLDEHAELNQHCIIKSLGKKQNKWCNKALVLVLAGVVLAGSVFAINQYQEEQARVAEEQRNQWLELHMLKGKGNDFIKISAQGKPLADKASDWACVLDQFTGLYWEKKTTDGDPRDYRKKYRWGGIGQSRNAYKDKKSNRLPGASWEVVSSTLVANDTKGISYDEWKTLVKAANREQLCGFQDWRMPSIFELKTLSTFYSENKGEKATYWTSSKSYNGKVFLNPKYFPTIKQLKSPWYWSSSPNANDSRGAWSVDFSDGYGGLNYRTSDFHARLVRGGQ